MKPFVTANLQMIAANCIDKNELPDFDELNGLLPKEDSDEEDVEIEIVEEGAPFLQGHRYNLHDLSPVCGVFVCFGSREVAKRFFGKIRLVWDCLGFQRVRTD